MGRHRRAGDAVKRVRVVVNEGDRTSVHDLAFPAESLFTAESWLSRLTAGHLDDGTYWWTVDGQAVRGDSIVRAFVRDEIGTTFGAPA